MNRLRSLILAALLAATVAPAGAADLAPLPYPPQRAFPAGSQWGRAVFGPGPSFTVNCLSYPLGPGVRVLDAEQHLILTGRLPGLGGLVVFQRDASGHVYRIWFMLPGDPSLANVPPAPGSCLFGD